MDPLPAFIPANVPGLLVLIAFVSLGLAFGRYAPDPFSAIGLAVTLVGFWAVGYRWSESWWT